MTASSVPTLETGAPRGQGPHLVLGAQFPDWELTTSRVLRQMDAHSLAHAGWVRAEGTGQRQATWAVILGSQSVSGPPSHAPWPGQGGQGVEKVLIQHRCSQPGAWWMVTPATSSETTQWAPSWAWA